MSSKIMMNIRLLYHKYPLRILLISLFLGCLILITGFPYLHRKWFEYRYNVSWIPPGEFWMGGAEFYLITPYSNPPVYHAGVIPSLAGQFHKVQLDGYFIGKFEVTNNEYLKFLNKGNHQANFPEYSFKYDDHYKWYPVHEISWNDANAYCEWLSQQTGLDIRLPTEAQWEKAARGVEEKLRTCKGNHNVTDIHQVGSDWTAGTVTEAYKHLPIILSNHYGLYDMPGNVSEYCRDWYSPDYFQNSPHDNPEGPTTGTTKVAKGGSQDMANTNPGERFEAKPNEKMYGIGFRIAIIPKE